jgi:hypothetical protein
MQGKEVLLAGEKLLWKGAPERGLKFTRSDFLRTFFGLFFFGFAVFWMSKSLDNGNPTFSTAFGIPFVLFGAYITIGRYFWEAYKRGRTTYTLTDKRAIIRADSMLTAVALDGLNEVALEERADGSGTIILGRDVTTGEGEDSEISYAPRFEFVKDVARVYQLVEKARNSDRAPA